jgi:hypothetical protein
MYPHFPFAQLQLKAVGGDEDIQPHDGVSSLVISTPTSSTRSILYSQQDS